MVEVTAAGGTVYGNLKDLCIWAKNKGSDGSLYRAKHELVFVWQVGAGGRVNDTELRRIVGRKTNVWEYPEVSAPKSARVDDLKLSPAVKPTVLVADAIRDFSKRVDIILDPFAHFGTTVMAAEKTGRRAAAIEFNPHFVDTIIRRWQNFTGHTAFRAADQMTFADCERVTTIP